MGQMDREETRLSGEGRVLQRCVCPIFIPSFTFCLETLCWSSDIFSAAPHRRHQIKQNPRLPVRPGRAQLAAIEMLQRSVLT